MEDKVNTQGKELIFSNKPFLFHDLMNKTKKTELIRKYNSLTLDKIIKHGYPSIGSLQHQHSVSTIEIVTGILINDLSESFGKDLKDAHIEELSIEINNSIYRNLSFEELYIAFNGLKKSNVIGKLTINKVLRHLEEFMEVRTNLFMTHNYNNHLATKFKSPTSAEIENERVKKLMHDGGLEMMKRKNN
jgi:hypothetical protein